MTAATTTAAKRRLSRLALSETHSAACTRPLKLGAEADRQHRVLPTPDSRVRMQRGQPSHGGPADGVIVRLPAQLLGQNASFAIDWRD
jgi:hypothetical protein